MKLMDKKYDEGMAMNTVKGAHEDMVKVVNAFNALPSGEKKIVMAMLGEASDLSEQAKTIQEIIGYWPPDYKAIFIELLKNNAKLSWGAVNTDKGETKKEDWADEVISE